MGGKASRDKGSRGEREFWNKLKELLPEHAFRFERNLQQWSSGGADSTEQMKPFVVEIKYYSDRLAFTDSVLDNIYNKINKKDAIPVLAYRSNRQAWKVRVPLSSIANPDMGPYGLEEHATISIEAFASVFRLWMDYDPQKREVKLSD